MFAIQIPTVHTKYFWLTHYDSNFFSDTLSCLGNNIEIAVDNENEQNYSTHLENVENFWNYSHDEASKDDDDGSCQWLVTEVRSLSNQTDENPDENVENPEENAENPVENAENPVENAENQSSGSTLFLPR